MVAESYRFGPAEWLWRSAAYGRKLPLRLASESSKEASVAASF